MNATVSKPAGVTPKVPIGAAEGGSAARAVPVPDLEAIYRRHLGMIFRICSRYCKDKEEAEDLTQEAFMRIDKRVGGHFKLCQVWALQNRPPQCGEMYAT
jgi:hypothetical protein